MTGRGESDTIAWAVEYAIDADRAKGVRAEDCVVFYLRVGSMGENVLKFVNEH